MSRIRGPSSLQQSKHVPQYSNRQLPPLSNAVQLRSLRGLSARGETHKDNIASCHEGEEKAMWIQERGRQTAKAEQETADREEEYSEVRLDSFFFFSPPVPSAGVSLRRGLPPLFSCGKL